jgi:hypothetical protein
LDERIQILKPAKGAVSITDALEGGRKLGRTWMDAYVTDTRPQVISSVISSLR